MTVVFRDKTRVINVSVSRRNEEILDLVEEFADGKGMQVLTHPIWWASKSDENAVSRLNRFAAGRHEHLRRELARNCAPYREAYTELTDTDEPK